MNTNTASQQEATSKSTSAKECTPPKAKKKTQETGLLSPQTLLMFLFYSDSHMITNKKTRTKSKS